MATSRRARLRQAVLAGLFSLGVGRRSVGDLIFRDKVTVDGPVRLSARLAAVLHTDVRVSMRFGPDRANRKPVLQLLDASGTCVAFAKVGVNALTRELVRREVAVLTRLEDQDLGRVRAPRVRYAGEWHDETELMVVDALPVWRPEPATAGAVETARIAAMRAVAGFGGVRTDTGALDAYLTDLAGRVRALDPSPYVEPLLAALDRVRRAGSRSRSVRGMAIGPTATWPSATTKCCCGTGSGMPTAYRSASTRSTFTSTARWVHRTGARRRDRDRPGPERRTARAVRCAGGGRARGLDAVRRRDRHALPDRPARPHHV